MYFSLFTGRPDAQAQPGHWLRLKRREAWTFVVLVIALIGFGLAPRPLVDSRFHASQDILRRRQEHAMEPGTAPAARDAGQGPEARLRPPAERQKPA
jgi:NADH:ubiquinone oxidoreductase subunit 4 (subunit M)